MRPIDLSDVAWRKSSYSNPDGGECVEVSDDFAPSSSPYGTARPRTDPPSCSRRGWASFVAAVKGGRLDG